jgi:hypothetical protein
MVLSEGGTTRHNFGKGPFNDYFIKDWYQLSKWFKTRRFLCEFQCSCVVIESSFDPGERLQAPWEPLVLFLQTRKSFDY